jgi:hypothetical protein
MILLAHQHGAGALELFEDGHGVARHIRIAAPLVIEPGGISSEYRLHVVTYSTTRASSAQAPPVVSASSVDRMSLDKSGFRSCSAVRLRDFGRGNTNTIWHRTGPSIGGRPAMASSAAQATESRHGATFLLDSIMRPPPTWRFEP